jgi:hypothetical protein
MDFPTASKILPRYSDLGSYLDTGGKPLYLLHCPKTAGTSLISYVVRLHGRGNCQFHYEDMQSVPILLQSLANPAERYRHRASHLPLAHLFSFMDQIGRDHFHWIACVRDPLARQVSHYRYLKKLQDQPSIQNHCIDFSSLETFTDGMPRNSQCRFYHPSGRADDAIGLLDELGVQVVPLEFMRAVIDSVYQQNGVPSLQEIHANRTDLEPVAQELTPAAVALITERFAEDDLLYRTYLGRVAPLMAGLPSPSPVESLGPETDLSTLRPAATSGNLHIFGSSRVAEKLREILRTAGVEPAGFIDSQRSGTLAGLPVRQADMLDAAQWQASTVLIAAEAFGPLHHIAASHGCQRIIDAFNFTLNAGG